MTLDARTLLILLIGGAAVAIALSLHVEWRLRRLLRGSSGKDLEEIVVRNTSDLEKLGRFRKELEQYLSSVEKRLNQSIRGVGTVRFNPFKGTGDGGNQSFATAFVDAQGNGVVFSTLYYRERVSVFAKPLKNGMSEHELTGEEKEAIALAKKKVSG